MRRSSFVFGLLLLGTSVQAQESSTEFNKRQFQGWGGLAVHCSLRPNDATNNGLCAWATQRLTLLARPLRISVIIVDAKSFERTLQKRRFEREEKVSTLLDVELDLLSTKGNQTSLYIGVSAGPSYSGAVET